MDRLRHCLYNHPFELVICIITNLAIWNVLDLVIHNPDLLNSISDGFLSMPVPLLLVWSIMGFIGSFLMFIGLGMSTFSKTGQIIEAVGLHLAGAMWSAAFVAELLTQPTAYTSWGQFFAISFGCFVRLLGLSRFQRILSKAEEVIEKHG